LLSVRFLRKLGVNQLGCVAGTPGSPNRATDILLEECRSSRVRVPGKGGEVDGFGSLRYRNKGSS